MTDFLFHSQIPTRHLVRLWRLALLIKKVEDTPVVLGRSSVPVGFSVLAFDDILYCLSVWDFWVI